MSKKIIRMQTMLKSCAEVNTFEECGLENIETFCGLPHHLYLPRSKEGKGQKFELFVFVNDVSQDFTEGTNDIEHM